jgi:hypothetical protein
VLKDTSVQFVCFITKLDLDEFEPEWERYSDKLMNKKVKPTLLQNTTERKNKYRFISKHEWPERDFHFSFINNRPSNYFPENKVKIVQAGGYIPIQMNKNLSGENDDLKLIAFINHNETDIEYYRRLPFFNNLNIFQAFYESCSYGYVLEFTVPEKNVDDLLIQLSQRHTVETGIYSECIVQHV